VRHSIVLRRDWKNILFLRRDRWNNDMAEKRLAEYVLSWGKRKLVEFSQALRKY
jgi:hypothetical protein